jgi:hypothetical protein
MNPLDLIFGQVANAVRQHSSPDTPGPAYDPNPILGALSGLFGQHAQQNNQQFGGYDPNADYSSHQVDNGILGSLGGLFGGGQGGGQQGGGQQGGGQQGGGQQGGGQQGGGQQGGSGNVLSSDADPYGDPEDQRGGSFGNVLSSDADPYGDPEDQR